MNKLKNPFFVLGTLFCAVVGSTVTVSSGVLAACSLVGLSETWCSIVTAWFVVVLPFGLGYFAGEFDAIQKRQQQLNRYLEDAEIRIARQLEREEGEDNAN